MLSYEKIILSHDNGLSTLTLNDPDVLNAVSAQMLEELNDAIRELCAMGSDVRCLLLTGSGRGFCSGANLADRQSKSGSNRSPGDGLRSSYHPMLNLMKSLDAPIVTAVNGAAAGIGMSLALFGDIVCAGRSAFFLQAFVRVGLIPDGGATYMLPRLIGWGRAMELSMLGERLPAEKAQEWGLVNFVYDDDQLQAEAKQVAIRLAQGPRSLGLIRKAYWKSWENSYESQLELEAQLQNEAGNSQDSKEGVKAFLEKRTANFTGC